MVDVVGENASVREGNMSVMSRHDHAAAIVDDCAIVCIVCALMIRLRTEDQVRIMSVNELWPQSAVIDDICLGLYGWRRRLVLAS